MKFLLIKIFKIYKEIFLYHVIQYINFFILNNKYISNILQYIL